MKFICSLWQVVQVPPRKLLADPLPALLLATCATACGMHLGSKEAKHICLAAKGLTIKLPIPLPLPLNLLPAIPSLAVFVEIVAAAANALKDGLAIRSAA